MGPVTSDIGPSGQVPRGSRAGGPGRALSRGEVLRQELFDVFQAEQEGRPVGPGGGGAGGEPGE